MTNQERLALLDKHGLCHKCEKSKQLPNRKFCAKCLEKIALSNIERYDPVKAHEYQARRRELYKEHKANGICVRCSQPATHGLYCYEHSIKAKRHSKEMAQKRKRERHERGLIPEHREQNNLCVFCGAPVEDKQHHGRACNACAKKMSDYSMKGDKTYWKAWRDAFYRGRKAKQW
jgi:hypothetical protein